LYSDVPLSFWGGIDERTGIVIDASHPLCGKNVSNTILVLPSGRGSCTASQVLLELILNRKSPRALILRDRDGLVCVGALVARCVLGLEKSQLLDDDTNTSTSSVPVLDVLQVTNNDDDTIISDSSSTASTKFDTLIESQPKYGSILPDGKFVVGQTMEEVEEKLDLLIRYARIVTPPSSTPTYIDVTSAHIDGCTYIGPGGLRFVEKLVEDGGRVKIPTTLNSVSTDLRNWKRLGIRDDESLRNSIKQADAYVALGCSSKSFTCAPYLLEKDATTDAGVPQKGDQIIWGESNAVVFSNSALGARTEKYADYLDICCAIVGKVPYLGVHLDEPRIPTMILEIDDNVLEFMSQEVDLLFPVLGHLCGSLSDGEVPLLVGLEKYADRVTLDHLKAFCAAFGTTAASPLIHISGITPEARLADIDVWKKSATRSRSISAKDLQETFDLLDQRKSHSKTNKNTMSGNNDDGNDDNPNDNKVDLVALGNPHLSLSEVDGLLRLVEDRVASSENKNTNKHDNVSVLACISRALYDKSPNVKKLEDFGFIFVRDTCWCMLLEPPIIPSDPNATILTNSGKYAHYGPGLTNRNFRLGSMKDCVDAAWTGSL
ncbi:hypothetical protein FRACYDRAFT_147078, partial [Fragilariopsis cylindrus CCMP1102]